MNRKPTQQFKKVLGTFPAAARPILEQLLRENGCLASSACHELINLMGMSVDDMLVNLLPLAQTFSMAPVSDFNVGAVALAVKAGTKDDMSICMGANMDFKDLALNSALHAEQASVINAWHQGMGRINAIAVSDAPCGHCRQFLTELGNPDDLIILLPGRDGGTSFRWTLSELLPSAFTPADLGQSGDLMSPSSGPGKHLGLMEFKDDDVVLAALSAAALSYAPYSGNYAGCAIQTMGSHVVNGRYAESVAYNPSVSPLHSVLFRLNLMGLSDPKYIQRIALVEKPTRICQIESVNMFVKTYLPHIELEYYLALEG